MVNGITNDEINSIENFIDAMQIIKLDAEIYPSYDKGKWAIAYNGIITELFNTPQDAFNWVLSNNK